MLTQAARSFSLAMVELSQERDILEPVKSAAEELLASLRVSELREFLTHPKIPSQGKKEILLKLVPTDTPLEFSNFLQLIIDRHREKLLVPIMENIIDLTLKQWGQEIVELISAQPLSDVEKQRIAESLSKTWGKKVSLKYRVNSVLIGGIIIRHDDQLIDGSLAGQINALKQHLFENTELPI
jgi:F-type H+-transporting ATPase subunit delta